MAVHNYLEANGLIPDEASPEHPLAEIVNGTMIASGKLAGALNPLAEDGDPWPPDAAEAAPILVRLKKARREYENALRGVDAAEEQDLASGAWLREQRMAIQKFRQKVAEQIADVRRVLEAEE